MRVPLEGDARLALFKLNTEEVLEYQVFIRAIKAVSDLQLDAN